jgi:hypothetical protein
VLKPKSPEIATAKGPTILALDERQIIWSIAGMIIDRRNRST